MILSQEKLKDQIKHKNSEPNKNIQLKIRKWARDPQKFS